MDRSKLNDIVDLINGAIFENGFECVDVEWLEKAETLRVYIDNGSEVHVDDCARVNRILFELDPLDELIGREYSLEVSSLGVEPPLRTKAHFELYVGKDVKLKLTEPFKGKTKLAGKLLSVSDSQIEVQDSRSSVDAKEGEVFEIPYAYIFKAKLSYAW